MNKELQMKKNTKRHFAGIGITKIVFVGTVNSALAVMLALKLFGV